MHRPSLARVLVGVVAAHFTVAARSMAAPTVEQLQRLKAEQLARSPRNRAEARRLNATNGRVARVGGGGTYSPLLSLHRRIEVNERRQEARFLAGRHVWA
ncbi:hypothetical protein SAMN02745194_03122 [Roseomonas rosea]|uniref:Uncharacterized protein n=1 Tax=Muricoccus roseus TaxID=198092 RepID=A0A1M6LC76_9PROT|nr:hypothetical protein [Roseomonas rosea]SHJ68764.1 hypothetical protein SAMN02745194_03122 [Roseomonas rosea]